MAQREGSTYLTLFIVAMVLFVMAAVAFFVVRNKKDLLSKELADAENRLEQAETSLQRVNKELRDLKALVLGARAEALQTTEDGLSEFKQNELKPVEQKVADAFKDLGMNEQVRYENLVQPYEDIERVVTQYQSRRNQLASDKDQAFQTLGAEQESFQATVADLRQQITASRQENAEVQARFEQLENERNQEQAEALRRIQDLEDQLTTEKIQCNRQLAARDNQILSMQSRLDALQEEQKAEEQFATLEPDGRLFKVAPTLQKGWIDLGREDHLMPGLIFRVFQTVKGGKKIHKGVVEVRKVEDRFAEVRIIEETDSLTAPISDGDFIASPFYDRSAKPIFVFTGQELSSSNLTMDFLAAKLGSYGVEVRDNVDIQTTFLVALKDYQASPQYETARELGVPVLREQDVLGFIGY